MGESHIFVCKDCKFFWLLQDYEITRALNAHRKHDFYIFHALYAEDEDKAKQEFCEFMGWPKEEST